MDPKKLFIVCSPWEATATSSWVIEPPDLAAMPTNDPALTTPRIARVVQSGCDTECGLGGVLPFAFCAEVEGKLVCAGGVGRSGRASVGVQRFDSSTNTWSRLPDMPAAAYQRSGTGSFMVSLAGKLVMHNRVGPDCSRVTKFDMDTATWSAVGDTMFFGATCRELTFAAHAVFESRVVFLGGCREWWRAYSCSRFSDHAFLHYAGPRSARGVGLGPCANASLSPIATVRAFCAEDNTWQRMPDMPAARMNAGAAALGDKLVVVGGQGLAGEEIQAALRSVVAFDRRTQKWTHLADLPRQLVCPNVIVLDGSLYVLGGYSPTACVREQITRETLASWYGNAGLHRSPLYCENGGAGPHQIPRTWSRSIVLKRNLMVLKYRPDTTGGSWAEVVSPSSWRSMGIAPTLELHPHDPSFWGFQLPRWCDAVELRGLDFGDLDFGDRVPRSGLGTSTEKSTSTSTRQGTGVSTSTNNTTSHPSFRGGREGPPGQQQQPGT